MAIPLIVSLLGSVLGGQLNKKGRDPNQMQFNKNNRTPIGDVTGNPQQAPATGPNMQQMPQQQSGNGFQNDMNKVSTIVNILQSLKGGQQNQGPYQRQIRRR
jgi:hypothetical protein